jgi:hypothetical protein
VHSNTEDGAGERARDEIEAKHYHRVSDFPVNFRKYVDVQC